MEKTDRQIYEEFADQLCEWAETGKTPGAGNQDLSYGLALQRARLNKHHVKMEYRLTGREGRSEQIKTAAFSDLRYTNKLAWRAYQTETGYYINGRKCLSRKENELLYTIITRLNNETVQAPCCCPNCGAISEVSALLEGCPYCHTRFLMSDLFPKVTNFYFLPDFALGENEAKSSVARWMGIGAAIGFLVRLPGLIIDVFHGENLLVMLFLALLTAGVFSVFGYFALSLRMVIKVMKEGVKQAPRAAGLIEARKKLTEFMKRYEPDFTFEYFFGKVQALLKMIIFSDDRSGLAVYDGPQTDCRFDSIVDAQFDGAVSLNGCRVDGSYCHLDLNVYMTVIQCQEDKLDRKSEVFRMGLCRNISRPADYGFSVRQVGCKSCGASFDASKERFCPYCKSQYDLKEDDWVVTYIQKR